MKLFDLHADTGYAVMKLRKQHKQDIITNYQLDKRRQGAFSWVCMASYFEGRESWADMQEMILALQEEIALCKQVQLVQRKQDLKQEDALYAICSVEGMCGIRDEVEEKIDWLHEHHIKVASLAWNDENALATGVRGNEKRGLTEPGRRVIARMDAHRMIVDVSHANEQTFWDILKVSRGAVIATHSNARALCDHPRNLNDEQLRAIADKDGLIGVVCAGAFVDKQRQNQTAAKLVAHMRYLISLVGIEHIALGCDFMDDYDNAQDTMLTDVNSPRDAQRIIAEMVRQGFSEREIRKIAYENAFAFFTKWLE